LDELFPPPWEALREGFLQLAVGAVLHDVNGQLEGQELQPFFHRYVLTPFLAVPWLPGVEGGVADLVYKNEGAGADLADSAEAVARWFIHLWPRDPGRPATETMVDEVFKKSLREAGTHQWRGPEKDLILLPADDFWAGPRLESWQAAWARQALALAWWPRFEWRQACVRLVRRIHQRNEVGARWPWPWLARRQSPRDYRLFEEACAVLEQARTKEDGPGRDPADGWTGLGLELPDNWPPLLLAQRAPLRALDRLCEGPFATADGAGACGEVARKGLAGRLLALVQEDATKPLEALFEAQPRGAQPPPVELRPVLAVAPKKPAAKVAAEKARPAKTAQRPEAVPPPDGLQGLDVAKLLRDAQERDTEWQHWAEMGGATEQLLTGSDNQDGAGLLLWFERFYLRFHEVKALGSREHYRRLAVALMRRLLANPPDLVWPVEQWKLTDDDPGLEVLAEDYRPEWVEQLDVTDTHARPGQVLRVNSFGDRERPPRLVVAVGAPADGRLQPWLKSTAGRKWFGELCRKALEAPGDRAARALKRLLQEGWCHCYPALDLGQSPALVYWPRGIGLNFPHVQVVPQEAPRPVEASRGLAVAEGDIGFAPTPDQARCQVLLGPGWPEWASRVKLHQLAEGPLANYLVKGLQELLKAWASPAGQQAQSAWEVEAVEKHIRPLQEGLARAQRRPELRPAVEEALTNLRALLQCQPWDVQLVPTTLDGLGKPWRSFKEAQLCVPHEEPGEDEHWGQVLAIEKFALARGKKVASSQRGSVLVGVGSSLRGLADLREAKEELARLCQQTGEAGPPGWPLALRDSLTTCLNELLGSRQGYVDNLSQFYRDFHTARPLVRLPPELVARIEAGLREALKSLGFEEYPPYSDLNSHPNCKTWVEAVGNWERGIRTEVLWNGWRLPQAGAPQVKAKARYE
jgi:hypothetical protein